MRARAHQQDHTADLRLYLAHARLSSVRSPQLWAAFLSALLSIIVINRTAADSGSGQPGGQVERVGVAGGHPTLGARPSR